MAAPPRYLPEAAFPTYAYTPGRAPHPTRDPRGHSHGLAETPARAIDPARWRDSAAYLRGVDLFNHGYYWEAHEAWEALWRTYPCDRAAARFLQALIRLAAAGVKAREGRPRGVARHAAAGASLLDTLAGQPPLFGLQAGELAATARRLSYLDEAARAAERAGVPMLLLPV